MSEFHITCQKWISPDKKNPICLIYEMIMFLRLQRVNSVLPTQGQASVSVNYVLNNTILYVCMNMYIKLLSRKALRLIELDCLLLFVNNGNLMVVFSG